MAPASSLSKTLRDDARPTPLVVADHQQPDGRRDESLLQREHPAEEIRQRHEQEQVCHHEQTHCYYQNSDGHRTLLPAPHGTSPFALLNWRPGPEGRPCGPPAGVFRLPQASHVMVSNLIYLRSLRHTTPHPRYFSVAAEDSLAVPFIPFRPAALTQEAGLTAGWVQKIRTAAIVARSCRRIPGNSNSKPMPSVKKPGRIRSTPATRRSIFSGQNPARAPVPVAPVKLLGDRVRPAPLIPADRRQPDHRRDANPDHGDSPAEEMA